MRWVALVGCLAIVGCGASAPITSVAGTVDGQPLTAHGAIPVIIDTRGAGYLAAMISDDPNLCSNIKAGVRKANSTSLAVVVSFSSSTGLVPGTFDSQGIFEHLDGNCQSSPLQGDGKATVTTVDSAYHPGTPFTMVGSFNLTYKTTGDAISGTFDTAGCDLLEVTINMLGCVL